MNGADSLLSSTFCVKSTRALFQTVPYNVLRASTYVCIGRLKMHENAPTRFDARINQLNCIWTATQNSLIEEEWPKKWAGRRRFEFISRKIYSDAALNDDCPCQRICKKCRDFLRNSILYVLCNKRFSVRLCKSSGFSWKFRVLKHKSCDSTCYCRVELTFYKM